jgi:hypothetical protein
VDKNPFAVNLAKLSLWLATFAKDHPFTFVDHTLRCGDSLVGLTAHQVEAFHWQPKEEGALLRDMPSRLRHILNARAQILDAADETPYETLAQKLAVTEEQMIDLRLAGDLSVAAFFAADKAKEREARRKDLAEKFRRARERVTDLELENELQGAVRVLKTGQRGVTPFHWELEFPEAFGRKNPGFDAIVGNPPFLGGTRISTVAGMTYFQWLTAAFPSCEHLCDLVAYFFRRAFALLRAGCAFGLIATNTISQGDTREGGLKTILHEGGQIYAATRRFRWPGSVAVVVSVIHVLKQCVAMAAFLDGKQVSRISAYLTEGTNDESPARLKANPYFSLGNKIYGQGFLFADEDPECTALRVRDELLVRRPDLDGRIRPYIGGEEILSHPRQMYHRYVILLSDLQSEAELEQYPDLRDIVRDKVRPGREILGDNPNNVPLKRKWWAFQAHRPELYGRLASMRRVLVTSRVNPRFGFALMPADWIFSEQAVVLCIESYSGFGTIQCRVHEVWARFFSSTAIELMRYAPSDCFETFPFPAQWETNTALEATGKAYYEFRAALMIERGQGLTKTYNSFHDPDEREPGIGKLRHLHADMDRAALDAYGWTDLHPRLDFILDYEHEGDEESAIGPGRKKPWSYRWVDEDRDEVLARLLELNRTRAEEGAQSAAAHTAKTAGKRGRKSAKSAPAASPSLFEVQEPTE